VFPYGAGTPMYSSRVERTLGSSAVLKEQLLQLLECNRRMKHLTLQVMPSARNTHAGLMGPARSS